MARLAEGLGGRVPLSRGTAVSPSPCQHFLEPIAGASHAGLLQGKTMDFVDVNESNARWVQDFRLKAYASPAKLESIDGAGPGGSGWGVVPAGVMAPKCSLTLFLEHPGACHEALWPSGAVSSPASCGQSSPARSGGGSWQAHRGGL